MEAAAAYFKMLAARGARSVSCSPESLSTLARWGAKDPLPPKVLAHANETLKGIQASLGDCRRCGLCETRGHLLCGHGDPRAKLVFVSDYPGLEEDRSGKALEGEAGEQLVKILHAIQQTPESIYLTYAVKCRPPAGRKPLAEEIQTCVPFLRRQLRAIRPEFICAMGTLAARNLLETTQSIPFLRGRFHDYEGSKVVVTYHPAYLLRYPEYKRDTWEDMKMLMRGMGVR